MKPFRYNTPSVPAEWPESYYALPPKERFRALQEQLKQYPDSADDLRRKELFLKRYGKTYDDGFMLGWMMLKVADSEGSNARTRPRFRHEVETELKRLCVLDETPDDILKMEWRQFANTLIQTYLDSPSYRSMFFGIGSWSQETTARRFAGEIVTVTKTVPQRAGFELQMIPLRDIIKEQFVLLVPDGEEMLNSAFRTPR